MANLSDDELQELERLEAVIGRDWKYNGNDGQGHYTVVEGPHRFSVCSVYGFGAGVSDDNIPNRGNLIAALRNAAPAILSELQRRRASDAVWEEEREELGRLRAALIRLGNATLDGGPLNDTGPSLEISEEYFAAYDAVKEIAVAAARRIAEQPHD